MRTLLKIFLIILCYLFFLPIHSALSDTIELRNMQVQTFSHQWCFTLNLSKPTNYRTFELDNPSRFILDLRNVETTSRLRYKELFGTPIKDIRYGPQADHVFRIVFDLRSKVKATTQVIPGVNGQPTQLRISFRMPPKEIAGFSWPKHIAPKNSTQPISIQDNVPPVRTVSLSAPTDYYSHNNPTDKKKLRNIIVVIDPGHGGKDPGTTGMHCIHEKNVVLAISKDLYTLINHQPGFTAVLTRNADYYISLRQRLAIARDDRGDMFVAIHADAYPTQQAQGVSIFALSTRGATSEAARWLAKRENKSELMGGVDLSDQSHLLKSVLLNLSQSATIRASLQIGYDVMKKVQKVTTLHHGRVEQAAFVVLKSPDIPSLLIETGFLSNPKEEKRLCNPQYQQQIARSIMLGIREYFVQHPPRFTWLSFWRDHPYA